MPEIVEIYIPTDDLIPIEDLAAIIQTGEITLAQDDEDTVQQIRIEWDDCRVTIDRLLDEELAGHRSRMTAYFRDLLEGRTDRKARKLLRYISHARQALALTIEPGWDEAGKCQNLLLGLTAYHERAVFVADGTMYNERGKLLLGHDRSERYYFPEPEPAPDDPAALAQARKRRTIARLRSEDIPTINHLPVVADEHSARLRPKETVVQRAIALALIAERAEGLPPAEYESRLDRYGIRGAVTPQEWAFARDEEPDEIDVLKFSQRWESCWALLWALQFVNELGMPRHFADVERIRRILAERSYTTFLMEAELRPLSEILDMLDLIYRYHWAIVAAELEGRRPPAKMEPAVAYERHYALNWLTGYQDQEWDDITTDT